MKRILVLGAGFAGLWAAVGAARKLDEIGVAPGEVEILVVDRNPYHNIRVRNYEADIGDVAIPLGEVLDPIGVAHREAEVLGIDPAARQVTVASGQTTESIAYDRLVLALGSQLPRPAIPGLADHGFDVDTYPAARRLHAHLAALGSQLDTAARRTVVVAGAGFTGIEVAAEMPDRLRRALGAGAHRIILIDKNSAVGATFGDQARAVICEALENLGVETRLGAGIASVNPAAVTLDSGDTIATSTVVWCAGMRASPHAATLPGALDALGRLAVDPFLRVSGVEGVFAAGDVGSCLIDGTHRTVMSCQFARPMGRFAGHNVVADLFGAPMLPLVIEWYATVLDLGAWGALYTTGWDRCVHVAGAAAKATKQAINRQRIYPPRTGVRAEILAAAVPVAQAAPQGYVDTMPGH